MEKKCVADKPAEILFFGDKAQGIFQEEATFEQLASGFGFSEGPIYMQSRDCLYFTDFPNDKIYRWDEKNGVSLYRESSNRAIGLAILGHDQIISCESRLGQVAQIDENESRSVAKQYQGIRLNSPNDVIVAKNGDIYFTDPLSKALGRPSAQGFQGVYRVSGSGTVSLICRDLAWPNGLAFNWDESILYVNDTGENAIYTFRRDKAGKYRDKMEFAKLDSAYGEGACDGMKVDLQGNVWVTGPAGLWVFDDGGACIAILKCPELVGNFCFGGLMRDELYITASSSVYRLKLGQQVYESTKNF